MFSKFINSKIYKITNDVDDMFYVGSTVCSLYTRWFYHKKHAHQFPERKLYKHMNTIGIQHFNISLYKSYACETKSDLLAFEQKCIDELKPTLNSIRAVRKEKPLKSFTIKKEGDKKVEEDTRNKLATQK